MTITFKVEQTLVKLELSISELIEIKDMAQADVNLSDLLDKYGIN